MSEEMVILRSIPLGYVKVHEGSVRVGDLIWREKRQDWIEVTKVILDHLGFLDARSVKELHSVYRKMEPLILTKE